MNVESASIPEFVAYHVIGGTLVDLRHADRMLSDLERQAPDSVRAGNLRAIRAAMEQLRHVTGPPYQRAPQVAVPAADVARVRQTVLGELRTAERDLTHLQERKPDPIRAMDLKALNEAVVVLARLVANGSD